MPPFPAERARKQRELARARAFIKQALTQGPRKAAEVQEEARATGIKEWALTDARQELAESRRSGFGRGGGWQWTLKASKKASWTKKPTS